MGEVFHGRSFALVLRNGYISQAGSSRFSAMAITITDEATEDRVRAISRQTGETPADVVARAVEALPSEPDPAQAKWDRVMAKAPQRDPSLTWEDVEREMNSIF
jgi:hypothetical protein